MKCDSCGNNTRINWGDASTTLCEACAGSGEGQAKTTDSGGTREAGKTWGDHARTSLLTGAVLTGIWVIIALGAGAYDPRGAAGASGLLGNAFGIFVVTGVITFVVKAVWHSVRKTRK